jgi:hypothetical protein
MNVARKLLSIDSARDTRNRSREADRSTDHSERRRYRPFRRGPGTVPATVFGTVPTADVVGFSNWIALVGVGVVTVLGVAIAVGILAAVAKAKRNVRFEINLFNFD